MQFYPFRMRVALVVALTIFVVGSSGLAQTYSREDSYLGFDRNEYPGDANLAVLHKTFAYAGYWLNNPPGENTNTWRGHRAAVESVGFGFLVLFNGRLYAQLKSEEKAARLGRSDAQTAVTAAREEAFPAKTIIFLDQEQGGRMLPEQKAYIYSWVDGVVAAGFRAGVYCSGMVSPDEGHVITAEDIREHAGDIVDPAGRSARATFGHSTIDHSAIATRDITFWVTNDACPPAPGCGFPQHPPGPSQSGVDFAEVWQFAQSPQRRDVAGRCTNYARDRECYPPGLEAQKLHVDVNSATSADPSHGRTR